MRYKIKTGLPATDLPAWLAAAADRFGTFADGRVDYTHADVAPVIMCTVVCGDKILALKRGHGLADANGMWSIVSGFIDAVIPIQEQVSLEIQEELAIAIAASVVKVGESYLLETEQERRNYIIFPCLVELAEQPDITLDHEHTEFQWVDREAITSLHILDDLPHAIDQALTLR